MNSKGKYSTLLKILLPLGIAVLTLLVYWNVTTFSFINFDDDLYIYNNAMTLRGLTPTTINWAFTSLEVYNWHPLAWLSHMFDIELYGLNAGLHHLTSVLIHICNSILLFVVFYQTTDSLWKSAFVAAAFALHPMHVESVAWVSERKDVLSLFFMLLATLSYFRFVRTRDITTYLLMTLLFVFALMSKPIAVVFPMLLIAFDIWPLHRVWTWRRSSASEYDLPANVNWKVAIVEKLPLFALAIGGGIVTIIAQGRGGAISNIETLSLWQRISHAAMSYVQYIGKLFLPTDLSFYYLYESDLTGLAIAVAIGFLLIVSIYALYASAKRPYLLAGWLIYLVALLPVIGLLQAGAQSIADRYTYIPLIGIAIILAWGVPDIIQRIHFPRSLPMVLGIFVLASLSVLAHVQVQTWKDNVSLYSHAIAINPENSLAYNNLGTHYLGRNELDSARRYFSKAITVNPDYEMPYYNLGLVEQLSSDDSAAVVHYENAIKLKPEHADAHLNLGVAYSNLGRYEDAIGEFRTTLRYSPLSARVHYHLGILHYRRGEFGMAAAQLRGALKLDPFACETYLAYANVLAAQDNRRGAEVILARAREIGCSEKDLQEIRKGFNSTTDVANERGEP